MTKTDDEQKYKLRMHDQISRNASGPSVVFLSEETFDCFSDADYERRRLKDRFNVEIIRYRPENKGTNA